MSLDYVNIKFNQKFSPRRRHNVPHIPIMVDKKIMIGLESAHEKKYHVSLHFFDSNKELQSIFQAEYDTTSSHTKRYKSEMQYQFAYMNYLQEGNGSTVLLQAIFTV